MENKYIYFLVSVSAAVLLRAAVSLHPYSGAGKSPMFGDFEAQRHWQEVTVNLPIKDWYVNTTDNDLLYWGLDYPPLTAYHSFLVGKWAQYWNESFVELHKSRGITEGVHKLFMRNTVLLADLLIYIPALLLCCSAIQKKLGQKFEHLHLLVALLYPGQILIDNGHFQYNNVSLGLAALAIAAILFDRNMVASVFFVLALNYKQMELYHALPFFVYLLKGCFNGSNNGLRNGFSNLSKVGLCVVVTFALLWLPWLSSVAGVKQVLKRIFPVGRGVFEDKVSNVWCVVNIFIKIRNNFSNEYMAFVCVICTLVAILPSCLHLFAKTSKRTFMLALINSSLGFFLFSFQVHEKSILLVTLPVALFFTLSPFACYWFLQVATFSMFPLLHKDGLLSAYIGLSIISMFLIQVFSLDSKSVFKIDVFGLNSLLNLPKSKDWIRKSLINAYYASTMGQILLLYSFLYVAPPATLPFLFPLLISAYSCGHFVLFFFFFNFIQFFNQATNKKIK